MRIAVALAMMMAVPVAACSDELDALESAGCASIIEDAEAARQFQRLEHDRLVNRIDFCAPYLRPWDQRQLRVARDRLVAQANAVQSQLNESGM